MSTSSSESQAREEQRASWHRGERLRVEAILQRHPSLAGDEEAVLALIIEEWRLRHDCGDTPELTEYIQRFGTLRDRLPDLLGMDRTRAVTLPDSEVASLMPVRGELPQIDGFEVLEELGRGGMGVVYVARQKSLSRTVAIKMILAGKCADAKTLVRFKTEAEAVARLRHPNVVQIHSVGTHDGKPYLCLEYVPGGSLDRLTPGRPAPERDAAQLVETLARAVHVMHQNRILHRDLKPSNILLTADGAPKITDFGLAKLTDADGGPTRTEQFIGTPNYMSPEQAAGGSKNVGPATDVYSLGAILYELLTGHAPFRGTSVLDTLEQVRTLEPPQPRRERGTISKDLETICLKCLEKDPAKRYASAELLADDLRRHLDGDTIQARPISSVERLWRRTRRLPARVAWVAFLGAVIAAGATAVWIDARAKEQRAGLQAEQNYRDFIKLRDDAMFYGSLDGDDAGVLGDPVANLDAAETAATAALNLIGPSPGGANAGSPNVPAHVENDVIDDRFALLLLLADVNSRRAKADTPDDPLHQKAMRMVDQAASLVPQSPAFYLYRARILDRMEGVGRVDRPERAMAAKLSPAKDAVGRFLVGDDRQRNKEFAAAMAEFHAALALRPDHFWSRFELAVCQLRLRQYQAAKANFTACAAQQPGFVWSYLFRSMANERLGATADAQADFDKAMSLDPNEDARYVLLLIRGASRFQAACDRKRPANEVDLDLKRAAGDFEAAARLRPNQYSPLLSLAHVQQTQGNREAANSSAELAIKKGAPPEVQYHLYLERARKALLDKKFDDALADCKLAQGILPRDVSAWEIVGRAQLARKNFAAAEHAFDQYLRKSIAPLTDVFKARGQARMKLGKSPQAVEDYTRAFGDPPRADAELLQHRGWAYFFSDAHRLALLDFDQAIKIDADMGDAYTGRALVHASLGDVELAVADADVALKLKPATPEMMHNVACVFALLAARPDIKDSDAYRKRAIDGVRAAITMVPETERRDFWLTIVRDPALASIRNEAAFVQLEKQLAGP